MTQEQQSHLVFRLLWLIAIMISTKWNVGKESLDKWERDYYNSGGGSL